MNALAEIALTACAFDRVEPAITDTSAALTGAELFSAARAEAARIQQDVGRSSPVVAVCLPLSVDSIVSLLAAILGDYTLCFLDPSVAADRREAVLTALEPDVIVDTDGLHVLADLRRGPGAGAEPGYVAMSSGSTGGGPKAVLSPWSAIAAFAPAGATMLELDNSCRWAEVSHPAYDMAMTNLLLALASGAQIHMSATLGDRLRPLRFIERVAATHVRLAPRFVELATAEHRPARGLSLRVWGSGGDRLHASHVSQAFALGVPAVVNTYGTSETIGFASAARLAASEEVPSAQGSAPIGAGMVGAWAADLVETESDRMLRISSPHLPRGYLFGEAGEYPRWVGNDAVLTGDVGVRLEENLFCLGRAGRRVKRNGSFVDLDEIDAVMRGSRGVASFTTITPAGELLSVVEASKDQLNELRQGLPSLLRPEILPDEFISVRQLPRLGNGKIDHRAVVTLAESIRAGRPTSPS